MVLQNKFGITGSPELAEAEERISKKKAVTKRGLEDKTKSKCASGK